ncbi:nuclear transport factor 2 family protein [Novosphingobium sp. RD2P27]|uniref:Nuclear transport factor 2 family protein n=1 Tax=Novosphingobium kalidii TaxID=3230299 RepID=A0ABV2CWG2_9SPHN
MAERDDIIELINLYALAMDTWRWDLFDRSFAPEIGADYGPLRTGWIGQASSKISALSMSCSMRPAHDDQSPRSGDG